MHSHDRTLLARLGFQDPDRKNTDHDLACQYLAEPETALRLAAGVFVKNETPTSWSSGGRHYRGVLLPPEIKVIRSQIERPISKGSGQYATTIGFLDVAIEVEARRRFKGEITRDGDHYGAPLAGAKWEPCEDSTYDSRENFTVAVEVKIGPVSASDVMRQLNLYREYCDAQRTFWALVTAYPVSEIELSTFKSGKVSHFYLTDRFTEWAKAARLSGSKAKSDGI